MSPEGPFIVSVEGLDEHVVCATLEQALQVAELLSQQHHWREFVQEQGATYYDYRGAGTSSSMRTRRSKILSRFLSGASVQRTRLQ